MDQPNLGRLQSQDSRNGKPLSLHRALLLHRAAAVARRLSAKTATGTLVGTPGADAQHPLSLRHHLTSINVTYSQLDDSALDKPPGSLLKNESVGAGKKKTHGLQRIFCVRPGSIAGRTALSRVCRLRAHRRPLSARPLAF